MKKLSLLFLIMILSINCYCQISFEQGYYIDNNGQKVNCLIKNIDWKNNPTQFTYKLSINSEIQKGTIKSVKEFGIDNSSKYVRTIVNIDRSSENTNHLSHQRKPIFEEENLFLKVLVEGKANLYQYIDGNLKRYFYNKEDSKVEQLVYKPYKTKNREVRKNEQFKTQLWNNLKCPTFKIKIVENLDYYKNELIDFFIKYNECNNSRYVNYEKKQKRDFFNLSFRPGINISNFSIGNTYPGQRNKIFDNDETTFRFGIEAELIMPFNKNKWSLILEPTYQYFKSENDFFKVDYKSIELPIGIRHYFFINENSKLFINGLFVFDISNSNSSITHIISPITGTSLDLKTTTTKYNLAFGLGYKHNNKYSIELRYYATRDVLGNYVFWQSDYRIFSIILGYSIF